MNEERSESRRQDRSACQTINPQSTTIHFCAGASEFAQSYLSIFASNYLDDCLRRQFAGAKSIIDSFPCKRLHYAGGIAYKQQIFVRRRKRVSSKRCDRSPGVVRRNAKSFCCPLFECLHLARLCDKANV